MIDAGNVTHLFTLTQRETEQDVEQFKEAWYRLTEDERRTYMAFSPNANHPVRNQEGCCLLDLLLTEAPDGMLDAVVGSADLATFIDQHQLVEQERQRQEGQTTLLINAVHGEMEEWASALLSAYRKTASESEVEQYARWEDKDTETALGYALWDGSDWALDLLLNGRTPAQLVDQWEISESELRYMADESGTYLHCAAHGQVNDWMKILLEKFKHHSEDRYSEYVKALHPDPEQSALFFLKDVFADSDLFDLLMDGFPGEMRSFLEDGKQRGRAFRELDLQHGHAFVALGVQELVDMVLKGPGEVIQPEVLVALNRLTTLCSAGNKIKQIEVVDLDGKERLTTCLAQAPAKKYGMHDDSGLGIVVAKKGYSKDPAPYERLYRLLHDLQGDLDEAAALEFLDRYIKEGGGDTGIPDFNTGRLTRVLCSLQPHHFPPATSALRSQLGLEKTNGLIGYLNTRIPVMRDIRDNHGVSDFLALLGRLAEEAGEQEEISGDTVRGSWPINLILTGPPGTGKSYRAWELAREIAELDSDDEVPIFDVDNGDGGVDQVRQVEQITFHPAFAYEDFIEGIRPILKDGGSMAYRRHDGLFKQMCVAATAAMEGGDGEAFVLIIDEINRGNVARIFGELITLLEESKRRGADAATRCKLTYSGEELQVPENLYVIGTMNTADRSIALLDAALRRRFEFEEMGPDFDIATQIYRDDGAPGEVMDVLGRCCEVLANLNAAISDWPDLGRGKQIGHTYLLNLWKKGIREQLTS